MFHNSKAVVALKEANDTVFKDAAINDFYVEDDNYQ